MLISLSTKLVQKDTEIVKFTKLIKSCLINLNYTLLIDLGQITHHNREADKTNLEKQLTRVSTGGTEFTSSQQIKVAGSTQRQHTRLPVQSRVDTHERLFRWHSTKFVSNVRDSSPRDEKNCNESGVFERNSEKLPSRTSTLSQPLASPSQNKLNCFGFGAWKELSLTHKHTHPNEIKRRRRLPEGRIDEAPPILDDDDVCCFCFRSPGSLT
jgi:hypothetical protein